MTIRLKQAIEAKGKSSAFDFPHLILGVICIFVYVGVEVIAIDTIGLYGQFMGFDLDVASKFGIYSLDRIDHRLSVGNCHHS